MPVLLDARSQRLNLADYAAASLLVAWSWDRIHGVELVFCRVELLPAEIPPPGALLLLDGTTLPGNGKKVWLAEATLSPEVAIAWYEAGLAAQSWKLPTQITSLLSGPEPHYRPLGEPLLEPAWPDLALVRKSAHELPFLARDLECPRVHHRLTTASALHQWTHAQRVEVSNALESLLCFPLLNHPSLWGSLNLVAINPVLRSVGLSLHKDGDDEGLNLELIPRRGCDLSDLTVCIEEERGSAVQHLCSITAPATCTIIKLHGEREFVFVVVDSKRHGRIYHSQGVTFIASVQIGFNIVGAQRRVRVDRGPKGKTEYEVSVQSRDRDLVVGTPRGQRATTLLTRDAIVVQKLTSGSGELWFEGGWDDAQAALRELIQRATDQVMLVDYFFAAPEVILVVPAVATRGASIRVLTSKEGLVVVARGRTPNSTYRDELQMLVKTIDSVAEQGRMQRADVRYMPGVRAAIHDRFLRIDDDLYILGSSLNEYGSRGTMLVKLRDPAPVIARLEEVWSTASDPRNALPTSEERDEDE